MRLSTDPARDDGVALETVAAAAEAGITIYDTARAYGRDETELGHNERLLARALRHCGAERTAKIITKGGMSRTGGAWTPDARARSILADCEASREALDGLPIDLYLLHSPDPRTPWQTSVRALARLRGEGLVAHVGLSNVNRDQLVAALDLVDIAAVEVAVSAVDDTAVRGGLVDYCTERGIAVIAHSPLGGPRRARALARRAELMEIARARGSTPSEVALAWVLDLSPMMVAIPGARRPETARSAARAGTLRLVPSDRTLLVAALEWPRSGQSLEPPASGGDAGEVVLVMGIPGAGKSSHTEAYVASGHARLNRDERGGSLRELNTVLDATLAAGTRRVVLDNTYLSRATRSHVVETAGRHRVPVRCVWIDTPLAQAQVNLVERLLDRFGALPDPDAIRAVARREPGIMLPANQMRAMRELEPPSIDEGFAAVERVPFARLVRRACGREHGGVVVAATVLTNPGWESVLAEAAPSAPHLLFDWRPDATTKVLDDALARLADAVSGSVTAGLCKHAGGPPVCWCRPPLPGLALAFCRTHGIDPTRLIVVGAGPAHRTLATTLGATFVGVGGRAEGPRGAPAT